MMLAAEATSNPPHTVGVAVLVAMVAMAVLLIGTLCSRTLRSRMLKPVAYGIGFVVGFYAITRGVAEFFIVDYGDPESYRHAWGGPSLLGVFLVHSGPGLAALIAAVHLIRRRRAGVHTRNDDSVKSDVLTS